jgi:hypothetical protein
MTMKFAEYAKAYAALIGSVLTALSATTGILPDAAKPWVAGALVVVTVVATWGVPNKPKAP